MSARELGALGSIRLLHSSNGIPDTCEFLPAIPALHSSEQACAIAPAGLLPTLL